MTDHRLPGTVGWVDLATTDPEGATTFYADLLGWHVERTMTPLGGYSIAWANGAETAGLMAMTPEMAATGVPPSWTPYIRTADIDATIEAIEEHGGKIGLPPFAVPGATRMAVVTDAAGAVFGLIESPAERGLHLRTDPGALCWAEMLTRDVPASEEFYARVFGWVPVIEKMGDSIYTTFKMGALHVAGLLAMPEMMPPEAPAHWLIYFDVRDADRIVGAAGPLGGRVAVPPTAVGPGRFAVIEDPQGAAFAVFEPKFGRS